MTTRTLALATLVALLGCVPETRVELRDVPDGGSDSGPLDGASSDQSGGDVGRDEEDGGASVDVQFDSSVADIVLPDVSADVVDVLDALDGSIDAGDHPTPTDVPGEADGAGDAVAADVGCPVCKASNAVATCIAGTCRVDRCINGFADCNGNFRDGCEVALDSAANCGMCGVSCGANGICAAGRCLIQRSCPMAPERGCGLISIAGGSFQMGSSEASTGEPLPGSVTVSSVVVDTHEVTVARFRRFWGAGHPASPVPVRYPSGTALVAGSVREPGSPMTGSVCNWTSVVGVREVHPINCVDWSTAQSFCVWDGARLPTEAEYEYISRIRGVEGLPSPRRYPWGDEHPIEMFSVYPRPTPCERAQFQSCIGDDGALTRRVGSFPSAGGVFDLSGNVSEWVADVADTYGFAPCWGPTPVNLNNPVCSTSGSGRSVRGGDFVSGGAGALHGAARSSRNPSSVEHELGFRCVRSP